MVNNDFLMGYGAGKAAGGGGGSTLITKTITANGTYAASSDNADGYSEVTVDVQGGADAVLLATVETSEPVNAIRIDFTEEMADYNAFMMEIQGTTSANTMFLCPQINTTGKQIYSGNAKNFHRWFYVTPYNTTNDIQTVSGYGIVIGSTNYVPGVAAPISYFYIKSFYENDTFATGTTMKIWGVKGGIPT